MAIFISTRVNSWVKCLHVVTHAGGAGAGQNLKLANQILVSTTIIGVCESLLYAKRAGLDLHATIAAVSQGAAGGFQIQNLGPRIADGDFAYRVGGSRFIGVGDIRPIALHHCSLQKESPIILQLVLAIFQQQ